MNQVILRGRILHVTSNVLPGGNMVHNLELETIVLNGDVANVPVLLFEPDIPNAAMFKADDTVAVTGYVRRRFLRPGSALNSRTEVVAHTIQPHRP